MNRVKAFLLGFFLTLAAFVPAGLAAGVIIFSRTAPADVPQSGIPVRAAGAGDARCILVMTGPQQPETFALLRFDAPENRIACAVLPADTVVLASGRPLTLQQAAEEAGPAQAAACVRETLGIRTDHYLYCKAPQLAQLAGVLGTAHLPLGRYLESPALHELGLDSEGIRTPALTPEMLAAAILHTRAHGTSCLLRAEGYLAFLRAGLPSLAALPDAVRPLMGRLSTCLTAADLFDYERIFGYLSRSQPDFRSCVLPGTRSAAGYELTPQACAAARECLGKSAVSPDSGTEDEARSSGASYGAFSRAVHIPENSADTAGRTRKERTK